MVCALEILDFEVLTAIHDTIVDSDSNLIEAPLKMALVHVLSLLLIGTFIVLTVLVEALVHHRKLVLVVSPGEAKALYCSLELVSSQLCETVWHP